MSNLSTRRHRWSWRSCFAAVKHNKKTKKQSSLQRSTKNGSAHNKQVKIVDAIDTKPDIIIPNEYIISNSCIIKIEPPLDENENNLIDGDSIEQINVSDINSSMINEHLIRSTQLDAIVEDSNEENSDDLDEIIQPVRLCCDRDIINDSNDLHSRLFDLSKMNHAVTQFNENGNLLGEFIRQIEKLKIKTDDIIRVSAQMPRDAELLEARYSTLLASIESLSLLLKIAQIPACRALINRLIFSIEQRSQQLNKLSQLASATLSNSQQLRRDLNDEDFLSFRSALSSYEHLFTVSS